MLTRAAAEGELGLSHKRWLGQKLGFPDSLHLVLAGRNWPLIQGLTILAWGFLLLTRQYFLVCKLGRRKSLILQVAEKSNQNRGKGVLTPRTSCDVRMYQGTVWDRKHSGPPSRRPAQRRAAGQEMDTQYRLLAGEQA